MKLLVTGGAGFIGSNFVRYMLVKHPEMEIYNLDKLTYAGNLENLTGIDELPNYHFIKGDIADFQLVDSVLQGGIDAVVNFAAESHVDRSIKDPGIFLQTNVQGTRVLLDASLKVFRCGKRRQGSLPSPVRVGLPEPRSPCREQTSSIHDIRVDQRGTRKAG